MYTISAFYQFKPFEDFISWKDPLYELCAEQGVRGSILLASEGINGTIAGPARGIEAVLHFIRTSLPFSTLEDKKSFASEIPFKRLKIKLKKEIVTLGKPVDPTKEVGVYLKPDAWNELLKKEKVLLIDVRNPYEIQEGTFKGAIDPQTPTFRDFPEYVKTLDPTECPPIAMYCTGGIRCEKASSYMMSQGFKEVYHLEGGILKYLETVPPEESLWEGTCFIFDDRGTVNHELEPSPRLFAEGAS